MKTILATILIFAGSFVGAATLECQNEDSKLTLKQTSGVYSVEGAYEYNKDQETGEYGSVNVLGCSTKSLDETWDLFVCDETTYSVYSYIFQVPQDVFSLPKAGTHFAIIQLSRDENDGRIFDATRFHECSFK